MVICFTTVSSPLQGIKMFTISSIAVPSGYSSQIFGGLGANAAAHQPGDPLGPQGAMYLISVPGLGTVYIEDIGWTSNGWGVRVNGGPAVWTYQGGGAAAIAIDINGGVTVSGGMTLTSQLIANMIDTGPLLQRTLQMIAASPALAVDWNTNAMATLFAVGFPRTCMVNMHQECCTQFINLLNSIQLPAPSSTATLELGENVEASWWACTACKVVLAAAVAAGMATVVACAAVGGPIAAPVAYLEGTAFVELIVTYTSLTTEQAATILLSAGAGGGAEFISSAISGLCTGMGACDSCSAEAERLIALSTGEENAIQTA
jgi:hypothetical protein